MKAHFSFTSLLLILLTASPITAEPATTQAPQPAIEQQEEQELSDDDFFAQYASLLQEDAENSTFEGIALSSVLDEDDWQNMLQLLQESVAAMRRSYEAQMAVAKYSLAKIQHSHPEKYKTLLATYRDTLRWCYDQDMLTLRKHNVWLGEDFQAELEDGEQPTNDFADAIKLRPGSHSGMSWYNLSVIPTHISTETLNIQNKVVRDVLTNANNCFSSTEFFSGIAYPIPNTAAGQQQEQQYRHQLGKLFDAAEKAWKEYLEKTNDILCPCSTLFGSATGIVLNNVTLAINHHREIFLTEMMKGFQEEEEETETQTP